MNQQTQQNENTYSMEIFRQLQTSKVNGFPFFAYTGIKPSIFSKEALYLKLPKNTSKFKSILVSYDLGSDTYTIGFYTHEDPLQKQDLHKDVYADSMVDLIIDQMGIR